MHAINTVRIVYHVLLICDVVHEYVCVFACLYGDGVYVCVCGPIFAHAHFSVRSPGTYCVERQMRFSLL